MDLIFNHCVNADVGFPSAAEDKLISRMRWRQQINNNGLIWFAYIGARQMDSPLSVFLENLRRNGKTITRNWSRSKSSVFNKNEIDLLLIGWKSE